MSASKQQRFIQEYLVDLNGTQAAIRAGYSPHTAVKQASRLLTKADIKRAIESGKKKLADAIQMDRRRILEELTVLASVNVNDIWDFSGRKPKLRPAHQIPPNARRAISSIEITGNAVKVKLWDKHKALALLAQHIGLLKEIHEGTVKVEATGKVQAEVKHGFDGDLTPFIDIVKRVAGSANLAGPPPNAPEQPVPLAPSPA